MDQNHLYKATEEFVENLFSQKADGRLSFHNYEHTRAVVNGVNEISAHKNLSETDGLVLYLAAWFHDTGYLLAEPAHHEEKSVELMKEFLAPFELPQDVIDKASACIMATKSPRDPQSLLEQIICDADTFHLGTKDFKDHNNRMFQELKNFNGDYSREIFDESTIGMLSAHQYYTKYGKQNLEPTKQKNMAKIKKKLKRKQEEAEALAKYLEKPTKDTAADADKPSEVVEKLSTAKTSSITNKGIQTMLRLTSSNHIELSSMADSKANILISVNAIIISIILSVLFRKLQTDPYLMVPTLIFLITAVTTIVIAILATRPKTNAGTFNDTDIASKNVNLLFFGNFHRMQLNEYKNAMTIMMQDPDYLYTSIVQDIYYLGVVLGKKYRLLRIAYNIFMVGIIVSVLAFAIATQYAPKPGEVQTITNSSGSPF